MPPVGKGAGGEGSPAVWKENGLYYPQPIDGEMGGILTKNRKRRQGQRTEPNPRAWVSTEGRPQRGQTRDGGQDGQDRPLSAGPSNTTELTGKA